MTVYEYGDTVNLSWAEPSNTATVVLYVTAPDGTESSPATAYSSSAWRATVAGNQYGTWLFAWVSSGTFTGTEQDTFTVGGPWYGSMATIRKQANIRADDTSFDDLIAQALAAASRDVEDHCDGRVFWLAASSEARVFSTRQTLCTADGFVLRLNDGAVNGIGVASGVTVEVGDGTTWTATTDYDPWPFNALAKSEAAESLLSQTDWRQWKRVRVTARWGWPAVPSQVDQATNLHGVRFLRRKDSPEGVAGSSEWGLVRVPYMDPDVKRLLSRWHTDFHAR